MAEFVIKLADERGRMLEQTQAAATADELRTRFTQAGYYVYSVKPRNAIVMIAALAVVVHLAGTLAGAAWLGVSSMR